MGLNLKQLNIKEINKKIAKAFVILNHYLKRAPNIVKTYGLFNNDILIGVITFSRPHSKTLIKQFNDPNIYELSRLCIVSDNRKNLASFFISKAIKLFNMPLIVSFADANYDHPGYIYQASNWIYLGQSRNRIEYKVKGLEHKHELSILYGFRIPELKEFYGNRLYKVQKKGLHKYVYLHKKHPLKKILISLPYPKG